MRQEKPQAGGPIGPFDLLKIIPFAPDASSYEMRWVGLEAVRWRTGPTADLNPPAISHHSLVLFSRPPEELHMKYEGLERRVAPEAGSMALVPAGNAGLWRCSSRRDLLIAYLEPALVDRVAEEAFDLDPARLGVRPLDGLDLPQLRFPMLALDAELTNGGAGGTLAAESLANVLAVHLIRHTLAPRPPKSRRAAVLPRGQLRAVVEFVEEHLDASPTLGQLAAVAHLSPYYFARQFKRATGLAPHQYLITRRVERAKDLLQGSTEMSLAEVAVSAGFSDQSQFSRHFKRLVGVTPGWFRTSTRLS